MEGGFKEMEDSLVQMAEMVASYQNFLIGQGFSKQEAFTLARDYHAIFVSSVVNKSQTK